MSTTSEASLGALLGSRRALVVGISGLVVAVMIVHVEVAIALVAPALLAVLSLIAVVRFLGSDADNRQLRRVLWWTMAVFIVHLVFGLVVTNAGGGLSSLLKAPDAATYHHHALGILGHWTADLPMPELPAGKEGYYFLLAGVYWMFGVHAVAGLVVNAAMSAAMVPLMTDTTRRLFGPTAAMRVPPILILLPSLTLFPSQLIKEAPMLLLIAVMMNLSVRLSDRIGVLPLAGLAAVSALMLTFRGHVALVLFGGVVAGLAFGRRQVVGGMGTGMAILALVVLLFSFGIGYSGFDAAVNTDLEQANTVRRSLAVEGRSGYDADVDISTSKQALSYLPRGLVNFVFGPFPWQIRGARQLPVVPDVLIWWGLLPSLWRGIRKGWESQGRRILVLGLPAITTTCLLSLAVGNFGTLVRERMQVVILVVPLIALGLSLRGERRAAERPGELSPVA